MLQRKRLSRVPHGGVEGAIEFLDTLSWDISLTRQNGKWQAWAGEHVLAAVDSQAELEAFLIGMTIGLAALPDSILAQIKKLVAE
jgi:hypothetical protein